MTYASFWQRLGAFLIDFICFVPLLALGLWLGSDYRLFELWWFIPGTAIGLWFHVDLVKRFGGTPGKLLLGIRIRKVDGSEVGYKEAILRHSVLFVLTTSATVALLTGTLQMTDAEHLALAWQERALRLQELAPPWYHWVNILTNLWIWSEFIVMLTNARRRALHDFMAGTVVVRVAATQQPIRSEASALQPQRG